MLAAALTPRYWTFQPFRRVEIVAGAALFGRRPLQVENEIEARVIPEFVRETQFYPEPGKRDVLQPVDGFERRLEIGPPTIVYQQGNGADELLPIVTTRRRIRKNDLQSHIGKLACRGAANDDEEGCCVELFAVPGLIAAFEGARIEAALLPRADGDSGVRKFGTQILAGNLPGPNKAGLESRECRVEAVCGQRNLRPHCQCCFGLRPYRDNRLFDRGRSYDQPAIEQGKVVIFGQMPKMALVVGEKNGRSDGGADKDRRHPEHSSASIPRRRNRHAETTLLLHREFDNAWT
jgi:hypothetical protein